MLTVAQETSILMSNPLVVEGEDPVELDGVLDGSSTLQVKHDQDSLADHAQTLHAKHSDLSSPTNKIRVQINDFISGGDNWEIAATHDSGGTGISWLRDSNNAYYNFAAMTDLLEVTVTATSDASPAQTKTRKIWVKTTPVDGQSE